MPDPTPDDNRKFMGVPGWIWDKLFWAFAVAALGYLTHTNTAAIQTNGENQVKAHDELKTEVKAGLSNVAAKVDAIPAAAPPQVIVEQKVIEQKPADAKAEPPGLNP